MEQLLDEFEIKVFKVCEDGCIVDMHENYPSDFGYVIPSIGDEIPCPMSWAGQASNYGLNGFLVVARRIFFHPDKKIVLICNYRHASAQDYNVF